MKLKNLSIRTQLFLVTALFAILIALASYTGASGMNAELMR
jgi:Tar ligand binding domain homologue